MAKLKGTASAQGGSWSPTSGVTAENYYALCKGCFAARGTGFLVALENGKAQGVEYSYSAKQWGAWLAFFKRAKIPHPFMCFRDWYWVPTEWPHEFTTDSAIAQDYEAGGAFERHFLAAKETERARCPSVPERAAQAAKAKARLFGEQRRPETPEAHLVAPEIEPPWHDKEALAASAQRLGAGK